TDREGTGISHTPLSSLTCASGPPRAAAEGRGDTLWAPPVRRPHGRGGTGAHVARARQTRRSRTAGLARPACQRRGGVMKALRGRCMPGGAGAHHLRRAAPPPLAPARTCCRARGTGGGGLLLSHACALASLARPTPGLATTTAYPPASSHTPRAPGDRPCMRPTALARPTDVPW